MHSLGRGPRREPSSGLAIAELEVTRRRPWRFGTLVTAGEFNARPARAFVRLSLDAGVDNCLVFGFGLGL